MTVYHVRVEAELFWHSPPELDNMALAELLFEQIGMGNGQVIATEVTQPEKYPNEILDSYPYGNPGSKTIRQLLAEQPNETQEAEPDEVPGQIPLL